MKTSPFYADHLNIPKAYGSLVNVIFRSGDYFKETIEALKLLLQVHPRGIDYCVETVLAISNMNNVDKQERLSLLSKTIMYYERAEFITDLLYI